MRQLLLFFLFGLVVSTSYAQPNDTTTVLSHQETHWDWNGNFWDTTDFSSANKTYRKILMTYTLGCPSGGCSAWDYTTRILLRDSINDTTNIDYELTRIITPYAGDKSNGWYHDYIIDVTDYAPLLKGKKKINAKFDGWQDGFTVSVKFDFIEGTPAREVLDVQQIYPGRYYQYGNAASPIENELDSRNVTVDAGMKYANYRVVTTGHGFGDGGTAGANPENCSEFCSKWFQVLVDNSAKYTTTVWKDDCGSEANFPQTGTWIYNRAGWCPGSAAVINDHDVTDFLTAGSQHSLDVNWQSYNNTAANSTYLLESHFFQYGAANFVNDAEIYDIINPTNYDRYSRFNPGCAEPVVVLRNGGSAILKQATIMYYVEGGSPYYVNWVGNLKFMETTEVTLPIPPQNFFKGSNKFVAKVVFPNGQYDEYTYNDQMVSYFEEPTIHVSEFDLKIRTNNRPNENWYILTNGAGDTIVYGNNLAATTEYVHNLTLDDGCYSLYINDTGGDGLYFWADAAQGSGKIQLTNLTTQSSDPKFLLNLETEFGNFLRYDFTVGYNLTAGNDNYNDPNWAPSNGGNDTTQIVSVDSKMKIQKSFTVYPNPNEGELIVALKGYEGKYNVTISNQLGAVVRRDQIVETGGSFHTYDLNGLGSGLYFITIDNGKDSETKKLILK